MARTIQTVGDSRMVYDPSLINKIDELLFDPSTWPDAPTAPGYSGGRGKTLFISDGANEWVLRHYHRGGFTGRWLNDTFVWLGESRTRPFREWSLLARLVDLELPVPRPVAGRFVRRELVYTADLITVRIPDVVPLSTRWASGPMESGIWRRVGEMVGRFHRHYVYHADLTAHNIQINSRGDLYLLDFDRGRIMSGSGRWMRSNISRLHRSLRKISADQGYEFSGQEWGWLVSGYRERTEA